MTDGRGWPHHTPKARPCSVRYIPVTRVEGGVVSVYREGGGMFFFLSGKWVQNISMRKGERG